MTIDVEKLRKLNPSKIISVKVKDVLELADKTKPAKVRRKAKEGTRDDSD